MGLKPVFSTPENWEFLGSYNQNATLIVIDNEDKYIPIPPFDFPYIITDSTIAIYPYTDPVEGNWNYAGNCSMKIRSNINENNSYNSFIGEWHKLRLFSTNILVFPKFANDFVLRVFPPKWFKSYTLSVYQYIGTGNADVESKVDATYDLIQTLI